MKKTPIIPALFLFAIFFNCNNKQTKSNHKTTTINPVESPSDTLTKHLKPYKPELPTIGLLMFNGVLQGEVIATSDVFSKPSQNLEQLFNVITIAETKKTYHNRRRYAFCS